MKRITLLLACITLVLLATVLLASPATAAASRRPQRAAPAVAAESTRAVANTPAVEAHVPRQPHNHHQSSHAPKAAASSSGGVDGGVGLKKHRVSKSSFHTSRGRVRDSTREFAGQGTSHLHSLPPHSPLEGGRSLPLEVGVHAWQPSVRQELEQLVSKELGAEYLSLLPSVQDMLDGKPEQIKVSVTARPGELVLNWLTWTNATAANAQIGTKSGNYGAVLTGQANAFVDPNTLHIVRYLHNVLLTGLAPSTTYFYRVGDAASGVWSAEMHVRTQDDGSRPSELLPVAMYGDLGLFNSVSMGRLSDEVAKGTVQAVIQVGDFSYNMDELQGMNGDFFLNDLQNVTALVPFMGCAGNHEQAFNFSHLANKFNNWNYVHDPKGKSDQNWWYSFDLMSGGVLTHYISLDTELYFWDYLTGADAVSEQRKNNFRSMIAAQWHWLVADLKRAAESGKYAWIIAYGHRPLYCSNVDDIPDCTVDAETLRKGPGGMYGFEAAFASVPGALDIYFAAHEHSYERTYPVFQGVIDWGSVKTENLYVDPKVPTYIIAGSAGCREYFDDFDEVFFGPWSAYRSATYGYGRMTIHNATHLHWTQLIDEGHAGTDELWIQKTAPKRHVQQEEPTKHAAPRQPRVALE